jgi:hypothetical protein
MLDITMIMISAVGTWCGWWSSHNGSSESMRYWSAVLMGVNGTFLFMNLSKLVFGG